MSDAIARYSVKSNPASTSTHNNVPKTVITTTSAIVSAYRRIQRFRPVPRLWVIYTSARYWRFLAETYPPI